MRSFQWFCTATAVSLGVLAASSASAQRPTPTRPAISAPSVAVAKAKRKKAPKSPRWRVAPVADAALLFDSNPYLLNAGLLARVDAPRRSDSLSGRYTGMPSASDSRIIGRIAVMAERKAVSGRSLQMQPWLEFDRYSSNSERSRVSFGAQVEQQLRHQGAFAASVAITPSYFVRNYLADAVDTNGNRRIAASERRYARGEYAERAFDIDYERRLRKSSKQEPTAVWLQLGIGYRDRPSAAPFVGRSLSGPTADIGLRFKHRDGFEADTRYELQLLGSPVSQQVVLLDEPAFGADFNGNGNRTETNVRSVQAVDRSRTAHSIRQRLRFPLSDETALHAELGVRWRQFGSAERFDVANNGRRDQRLRLGAHVTHRLSSLVRLEVGARYDAQRLNRRTDLGAEGAVDDYSRTQAWLGARLTP